MEKLKYSIKFNADGEIEVSDVNNICVLSKDVDFPEHATEILGIKSLTIVEATGSHYIIICSGGVCKKYYLPH